MDIEKLIEQLRDKGCEDCPHRDICRDDDTAECIIRLKAATALSKLRAENEKLRAERDDLKARWEKYQPKEHWETLNELCKNLHDELEQVKKERDAAVWDLKYLGDCVVCKYNNVPCREKTPDTRLAFSGEARRRTNMERLTYDFCIGDNHCWEVKGADNLECREVCARQMDNGCKSCPIAKAFDRLASIEDILGDEYDLDRFRELAQADREGRCVVLQAGEKMYTAEEMDRVVKINIRLLEKFKEPLLEEYGSSVSDAFKMVDTLYQEQNSKMPEMWYEYGFGWNGD